jgi:hypothetical protein
MVNVPLGVVPKFLGDAELNDPLVPQPLIAIRHAVSSRQGNNNLPRSLALEVLAPLRLEAKNIPNGKSSARLTTPKDRDRAGIERALWGPVVVRVKLKLCPVAPG